jgi:copper chaperone
MHSRDRVFGETKLDDHVGYAYLQMIAGEGVAMKYTFTVPDMSCDHCRMRIDKAVAASGKATAWTVDLKTKTVGMESEADRGTLAKVLSDIGYPPSD